jgi:hypothetical protein
LQVPQSLQRLQALQGLRLAATQLRRSQDLQVLRLAAKQLRMLASLAPCSEKPTILGLILPWKNYVFKSDKKMCTSSTFSKKKLRIKNLKKKTIPKIKKVNLVGTGRGLENFWFHE